MASPGNVGSLSGSLVASKMPGDPWAADTTLEKAMMEALERARAQALAANNHAPVPQITNKEGRLAMVASRLRLPDVIGPFAGLDTYVVGDTVWVAVVSTNGGVMLQDALDLFPSDTLITQLRLLQK